MKCSESENSASSIMKICVEMATNNQSYAIATLRVIVFLDV